MTTSIRILDTGLMRARWNVAVTATLAERHAEGLTPDTVRMHRYHASVLLGCSQDVQQTIDLDYCREYGIEIARRVTGGGCVFMSPGMLAWEVVVDRRVVGFDLKALTRRVCEGVASGLARLGVAAGFRPPGDIEIGGLKVSGSSGRAVGSTSLLQGTVLLADDIAVMARALRVPEAALRERVTWLGSALQGTPPVGVVADAALHGLMGALDRSPARDRVKPEELARADALLREELGTEAFVMGHAEAMHSEAAP